jgi:hypothetical protein
VKRSRDQSHEAPSRRSCRTIVAPDSSFHCQARARNAVAAEVFLRLALGGQHALEITCTAIEAWSVSGEPERVEAVHALHARQVSCRVMVSA